jgi:hypothetical protein
MSPPKYDPIWDTPEKPKESEEDRIQREDDEAFLKNPKKEKDGLYYYILPAGNNLYRGDDQMSTDSKFIDKYTYFGTNKDSVEQYGKVFKIQGGREYKLLALDNEDTINAIYENAPEIIQIILERNYGYNNKIRISTPVSDNKLSAYLCEKGYDGYAISTMKTDFGGVFHKEVMICNPSGLEIVEQITGEIIPIATNGNSFATPVKKPKYAYITPGGKKSKRKVTKKKNSKRKSRTYKK